MIRLGYPTKAISKDNEKLYNKQGRFFLSAKYKQFENYIRILTVAQLDKYYKDFKMSTNPIIISMWFHFKNKRCCDLTNLPKSINDSLQGIIFKNDNQINECHLYRVFDNTEKIIIQVEEAII